MRLSFGSPTPHPAIGTRARSTALFRRSGDTMSEFNIRSESIDVEQLMEQIRARIRDKRGVDYTEQQVRELAAVKLDQFLDPGKVRSDLVDQYRRIAEEASADAAGDPPARPPAFEFDGDTIYRSSRGVVGGVVYAIRRLLRPVLKLFFNPTPIVHALHTQQLINQQHSDYFQWTVNRSEQIAAKLNARAELDALTFELLNNLVVEMTRLSVDVKNHKMRVESIAGRLDFDERRARALESVVEYRIQIAPPQEGDSDGEADESAEPEKRKRRRRRGRRRSGARPGESGDAETAPDAAGEAPAADASGSTPAEASAPAPHADSVTREADGGVAADTQSETGEARNGAPEPDDPTAR